MLCYPVATGWTTSFVVAVLLLTLGYAGAGVALGRRQGKTGALMKSHPHFEKWVALQGLVGDGIAFSRSRLGGQHPRPGASVRQPLVAAGPQPGDSGGTKRSKGERREPKEEKEKRSSNPKTKRAKEGRSPRQGEGEGSGSGGPVDPTPTGPDESTGTPEQRQQLQERALVEEHLHQSQAKIKVVGING
jgi:hypothetical protein|eukprot:COSAG03_NODE_142_length_11687_cov_11.710131_3_plen_189_part_00